LACGYSAPLPSGPLECQCVKGGCEFKGSVSSE
jgi:hypothetical protein